MGLSRKHPLETHNLCVLQGLKSAPTNRTPYKVGGGPTGRRLLRKLSARGIAAAAAVRYGSVANGLNVGERRRGVKRFDAMKIAEGGRALLVPYKGVGDEICALRGKRNLHSSTTVQR